MRTLIVINLAQAGGLAGTDVISGGGLSGEGNVRGGTEPAVRASCHLNGAVSLVGRWAKVCGLAVVPNAGSGRPAEAHGLGRVIAFELRQPAND